MRATLFPRSLRPLLILVILTLSAGLGSGCSSSGSSGDEDVLLPAIENQPVSQTVRGDDTVSFIVEAVNSDGVSYQWQQSLDGTTWTDIPGATNSTFEILALTAKDDGWNYFRCVLTNQYGSTISSSAALIVDVVFVKVSEITDADGTSWDRAYPTLQEAFANVEAGWEIWVAAGTYTPGTDREDTFSLQPDVAVYGGFDGSETCREARDPEENETILSGDIGTPQDNSDNCYHVVTGANNAILDGFSIIRGNADGDGIDANNGCGGGMFNLYSNPTVSNCAFSGNSAVIGGGMSNLYGSPTVTNCSFSNNSATYDEAYGINGGGGMCNWYSSPEVTSCTFSNNTAAYDDVFGISAGGGMCNGYSDPTVTSCTFSGNSAVIGGGMSNMWDSGPTVTNCSFSDNSTDDSGCGGGMCNYYNSDPTVASCTFSGNSAGNGGGIGNVESILDVANCSFSGNSADFGGGMSNMENSIPTVTNCTFSNNSASDSGGGMFNSDSSLTVTNCILWDNGTQIVNGGSFSANVSYSCLEGGTTDNNNITDDPLLNTDLTLQSDSPCIDTGNNAAIPSGINTDLADNPRISGSAVDMGAYEYQQ